MRPTKLTVALATAGAGVICLAPGARADTVTPGPSDVTPPRAPSVNLEVRPCIKVGRSGAPGVNLSIVPCVKVGLPGALGVNLEVRPCIRVGAPVANLEIHPCIKVGSPGGTSGRG